MFAEMQSSNPFAAVERPHGAMATPTTMSPTFPMPGMSDMSGYFPSSAQVQPVGATYASPQTHTSLFQSSAEVPRFAIPYRYWEDGAISILIAYDIQDIQRVIRYRLFRDENIPRRTLRDREPGMIMRFLSELSTPQEAPLIAELPHNQKVEEIIRRSRMLTLSFIPWSWFPTQGNCDPQAIAAAIEAESHLQFSRVPFEEWVRYSLGYRVISVEWFLQQHTNLYLHLLNHLQGFANEIQIYLEVEKALRDQSPFAHRAVAQCLQTLLPGDEYGIRASQKLGFEFIAGPIQHLFRTHPQIFSGILKVLCVLAIRFRQTYVHASRMDWYSPFDTETTFIQDLFDSASAEDMARLVTKSDKEAFANLTPENIIVNDNLARQHLASWHKLASSIWECCSALPEQIEFIHRCVQSLFALRNYHSVTAILTGLQRYSVTSSTLGNITNGAPTVTPNAVIPPEYFYLLAPWDNYAAYGEQFAMAPGLPFLLPHISQAMQEGPVVIYRLFQEVDSGRLSGSGLYSQA